MKDLPKVFHNKINKAFDNNKSIFYSYTESKDELTNKESEKPIDAKTISQKINSIFASPNYVYKANVLITLKDKKITKRIIGRNKNYIITMDNDLIPISDIIDIESIKK